MRVRVINMADGKYGFYGTQRRYQGQEFDLVDATNEEGEVVLKAEDQFSGTWMEKIEADEKAKADSEDGGE